MKRFGVAVMALALAACLGWPGTSWSQQTVDTTTTTPSGTSTKPGAAAAAKATGWRNLSWEMDRDNIQRLYAGSVEVLDLNRLVLHKIKINGARAQVVLQLKALKLYGVIIDIPQVDQAYARGLLADLRREFGLPSRGRPGPDLSPKLYGEKDSFFYAWSLAGQSIVLVWGPKRGAGLLYLCTQEWCADVSLPFLNRIVLFAKVD